MTVGVTLLAPRPDLESVGLQIDAARPSNFGDEVARRVADVLRATTPADAAAAAQRCNDTLGGDTEGDAPGGTPTIATPDDERACDEAVARANEPRLRAVLELDRSAHACRTDAAVASARAWSAVLCQLADAADAEAARARAIESDIHAHAREARAYAQRRTLDATLEADTGHVLDQHRQLCSRPGDGGRRGGATDVDAALRQCGAETTGAHTDNLRALQRRALMEAYARAQLAQLVDHVEAEHLARLAKGDAMREAVAQLPDLERVQHARSAQVARRVDDLLARRRAAFSQLVRDQFGASDDDRVRINRCLQLLNAMRERRGATERREALVLLRPALRRLDEVVS